MMFVATITYELHPSTEPTARKLLRAELAGRRWREKWEDGRLPESCVYMMRDEPDEATTDTIHAACGRELEAAVGAVAKMGKKISLTRAWVQVAGAGTFGLVNLATASPPA